MHTSNTNIIYYIIEIINNSTIQYQVRINLNLKKNFNQHTLTWLGFLTLTLTLTPPFHKNPY